MDSLRSIPLPITIRCGVCLCLLIAIVSCAPKKSEYDAKCQRGWPAHYEISRLVHDRLSKIGLVQYIALKGGNDRGNYSFYILGLGKNKGIFLYANDQEIRSSKLPLAEAKRIFSEFAKQSTNLQGYTGSGRDFSHLVCEYIKIKSDGRITTATFYNHVLPSATDPNLHGSPQDLAAIRSKLTELADKTDSVESFKPALPHLADPSNLDSLKSTNGGLFYEVP